MIRVVASVFSILLVASFCHAQPYGLTNRLDVRNANPPQHSYGPHYYTTNAFPGVGSPNSFSAAVAPRGETNRLFLLELYQGVISVITNLAQPDRTVAMTYDPNYTTFIPSTTEDGFLGLAIHPGFATNRFLFVFYSGFVRDGAGVRMHVNRLSRFQVAEDNPSLIPTNSETIFINQIDIETYHNGGDIHFGPDGYLYVAIGDDGVAGATNNTQTITNKLFSGILRIDVDKRPGNLVPTPHPAATTNYLIPADNPFVGATNFNGKPIWPEMVRTEFWAVGLRNPWRMSFDPVTGRLFCADVGSYKREEINVIVKGGNYGWAFREGTQPGLRQPSFDLQLSLTSPIYEYGQGCVIGGIVFYGHRLSRLDGKYLYNDLNSGRMSSLRFDGQSVSETNEIVSVGFSNIGFARHPASGEPLLLGGPPNDGKIFRVVWEPPFDDQSYGALWSLYLFDNLTNLTISPGFVPYEVNVPSVSADAVVKRWFHVYTNRTVDFSPAGSWGVPRGIFVQHFELERTNGVPESRFRVETRVLHVVGTNASVATYRWVDQISKTSLVRGSGTNEAFTIWYPEGPRQVVWRYPSRAECLSCHTARSGGALGFNAAQMNREFQYPNGVIDNQIRAMEHAGYFSTNTPVGPLNRLPALAHPTNEAVSVEWRARSALAVNCASCHRPGGMVRSHFDARIEVPLSKAKIVDGAMFGTLMESERRVIAPGSLVNSSVYHVFANEGPGHFGLDEPSSNAAESLAILRRWITNDLPEYVSFSQWQTNHFGTSEAPGSDWAGDPDSDFAVNGLEYLTSTDPLNPEGHSTLKIEHQSGRVELSYLRVANRRFELQWSNNPRGPWEFLDVPENKPMPVSTNATVRAVDESGIRLQKFYRVTVSEP